MAEENNLEKELDREREKLNRMINEARQAHQPSNEAILEQSRKVDTLLARVQKARLSQRSKTDKSRDNWEGR